MRSFHTAAWPAGACDRGAPGLHRHSHPHCPGAYVIGPDGHKLEAVCHEPAED